MLVLVVSACVGLWVAGRQARSRQRLVRHLYRHLDELLGARRFESDRAATRRHYLSYINKDLARLLYTDPKLGGTVVLPSHRRRRLYVQIDWPPLPWPEPYRLHHIRHRPITLHWTSEAPVNSGSYFEWLERGRATSGGGLAQALGFEWSDGLFTQERDHARAQVTFTCKRPVTIRSRRDAELELG